MKRPLLISGLPRSGTTWVGEIVRSVGDVCYRFEPDNEKISPAAWLLKEDLHRFPYLAGIDDDEAYGQLWRLVFGGMQLNQPLNLLLRRYFHMRAASLEAYVGEKSGFMYIDPMIARSSRRRSLRSFSPGRHPGIRWLVRRMIEKAAISMEGAHLVIKSVHCSMALDWIDENFKIDILVVLRNPYSLYASYKRLNMADGNRNVILQDHLRAELRTYLGNWNASLSHVHAGTGLQIAVMLKSLERQIALHPDWFSISHDRLCANPRGEFRRLFQKLGLAWSQTSDETLERYNRVGRGFTPERRAGEQPHKWRSELKTEEVKLINQLIEAFELAEFLKGYVY